MDYKEMNLACSIKENDCQCSNEEKGCNEGSVKSFNLNCCPSTSLESCPKFKVPVVLSEFTVQIDTESRIKLCEPAIEIKRIKKNIFLNQCRLIAGTKKIFIKGFVRKSIEYATIKCHDQLGICGDIKHTTVHVPFTCLTELKNLRTPEFRFNTPTKTMNYFDEKNMCNSINEMDMFSEEVFNERVFYELVSSKIFEADIVEESEKISSLPDEYVFQTFIEKEVIYLTIKLLQNQQICEEKKHTKCSSEYDSSSYDWDEQQEY